MMIRFTPIDIAVMAAGRDGGGTGTKRQRADTAIVGKSAELENVELRDCAAPASGVTSGSAKEAIHSNRGDVEAPISPEDQERRDSKRIKSEPAIAHGDEEITVASLQEAETTVAAEHTAQESNAIASQTLKPTEPSFGTPPHPATCDPNMDPDSFVKAMVHAYLGYTPRTLPALSLPESYFPGLNEEHMACYGVEVVAAVRENNLSDVKALHSAGHPLACCNRFGESLMHMACRRGYAPMFQFLLNEAGVDVRIRDDCGRSPLHDACWNRDPQYEIVDALLQRDPALLFVADKRGHTPFAYARREHWGVWKQFLSDRVEYIVRGMHRIEERQIFCGEK